MKLAASVLALATLYSPAGYAADRFGESCTGTEWIQVAGQAARTVPYSLMFSADLTSGHYCYAQCEPNQTFKISDRASSPIKLADVRSDGQTRLMTFDRRTAVLKNYQTIDLLEKITRTASSTCQPAAFHEPVPLPGD